MPGFGNLSAVQIDELIAYLKTLRVRLNAAQRAASIGDPAGAAEWEVEKWNTFSRDRHPHHGGSNTQRDYGACSAPGHIPLIGWQHNRHTRGFRGYAGASAVALSDRSLDATSFISSVAVLGLIATAACIVAPSGRLT
jgi:hypothetical protein